MEAMQNIVIYFLKGGFVMWPLLICSIIVTTIGLERYFYYRNADSGSKFAGEICNLFAQGKRAEAVALARNTQGECARIIVESAELPEDVACPGPFMEAQAGIVIAKLRSKLHYLSVIVTMSPLLGLLGTIVGMIDSFSIFGLEEGQPLAITDGIGEALIATATGLCVAILALSLHSYFAHRLDTAITDLEQTFSAIIDSDRKVKKRETA